MIKLTEFLLARIAEDEEQAEACKVLGWVPAKKYGITVTDPTRILRECAAKRVLVGAAATYSPELEHGDNGEWAFDGALRAIAAVYADHPDYQPAWAQEG